MVIQKAVEKFIDVICQQQCIFKENENVKNTCAKSQKEKKMNFKGNIMGLGEFYRGERRAEVKNE